MDLVLISEPDQIRRVEASGDVDRLRHFPTRQLPAWARFYFRATRFHEDTRDLWFLAFEPASNPAYATRHAHLSAGVRAGYTAADVERVARLLDDGADEATLAHALVHIVDRRFVAADIPVSVCQAANLTLQSIGEAARPGRYRRALAAQRSVTDFCAANLPAGAHAGDNAHNIGTIVKTMTRALRMVAAHPGTPVEALFTAHPLTPQAPRVAVRASTLEGLLRSPMRPSRTVVLYEIGAAATATGDPFFTFGTGRPERACVFMDFFLAFTRDVQRSLRAPAARSAAETVPPR